mgnify:CR=1 FL=1
MEMDVEIDLPDFRISSAAGDSDVAVVAFSGVGLKFDGMPVEEFRNSLNQIRQNGRAASVIFVIDKKRKWYNDGVMAPMVEQINAIIDRLGARRTVTLGNSMGGFGAIVFARRLRHCRQAIAFCPQSSIDPAVAPFETRWPEWRSGIRTWQVSDAAREFDPAVAYDIYFGKEDKRDVRHAQRFAQAAAANVRVNVISGCSHDVARHLREAGKLDGVLQSLIWGEGPPPPV